MAVFDVPISWTELVKRTAKEFMADDCLGLAAQLAYYFFLAVFPAILFLLALGSFFPLQDLIGDVVRLLQPVASPEMLGLIEEQMRRISEAENGGLLTFGVLGALWSSSAAMVAVTSSLNTAYDIEEARPWWKVRLIAIGLTLALSVFMLLSFTLIVAGPSIAEYLGQTLRMGTVFEWTWKIVQWPVAFALVCTAIGLVYYYAPDAEQDWVWLTPGALVATTLWVLASLAFKVYVSNFADYNATYGTVGGVMVLMLWFYVSGLAVLLGAELNAEIEHASPHGKDPGEKVPGQRRMLGVRAARAWKARLGGKGHGVRSGQEATSAPATASAAPAVRQSTDPAVVDIEPAAAPVSGGRSVFSSLVALGLLMRQWRRSRKTTPAKHSA
ncbi:MAG: YihY/virulence factor BrkB family protein [Acidobacteria bacterium]|nr:YihY/virulence factor BrkB family protein [Acidobacteriota bacterium]